MHLSAKVCEHTSAHVNRYFKLLGCPLHPCCRQRLATSLSGIKLHRSMLASTGTVRNCQHFVVACSYRSAVMISTEPRWWPKPHTRVLLQHMCVKQARVMYRIALTSSMPYMRTDGTETVSGNGIDTAEALPIFSHKAATKVSDACTTHS